MRLAVPKWTRRQGEETPLGPSSGEETPHIPRRDELQGEEPPLLSVSPFKPGSAQRLRRSSGKVDGNVPIGHFKSPVLHKVRCLPLCHSLVALGR